MGSEQSLNIKEMDLFIEMLSGLISVRAARVRGQFEDFAQDGHPQGTGPGKASCAGAAGKEQWPLGVEAPSRLVRGVGGEGRKMRSNSVIPQLPC